MKTKIVFKFLIVIEQRRRDKINKIKRRSNSKGFGVPNIVYLILVFVSTHTGFCLSSKIFAHREITRCSGSLLFLLFLFFFINACSFCSISTFIYFVHFVRLISFRSSFSYFSNFGTFRTSSSTFFVIDRKFFSTFFDFCFSIWKICD